MQVIAREMLTIVDNLIHLLIKVRHFIEKLANLSIDKGLEHFSVGFKFITI